MLRFLSVVLVFLLAFVAVPALVTAQTQPTQPQPTPTQAPAADTTAAALAGVCGSSYVVQYGDTMYSISRRCGVDYNAFLNANPGVANPNWIYPGQVLIMPGGGPGIPPTGGTTYTVVSGDTLGAIALRSGVTLAALLAANPAITNANLIYPGQVINIPTASGPGIPPTGGTNYTVVSGDTLSAIARRYNRSLSAILAANPAITNANLIYPGQVIRIP